MLAKSIGQAYGVPATLVQEREIPGDPEATMLIKVQIDESQVARILVLHPISRAGILTIDDGREWRTYLPDQRTLRIQASPRMFLEPTSVRVRLIRRNYELSFGRSQPVAGRETVLIVARPRDPKMDTRMISLDETTKLLLRYDVQSADGKFRRVLDTKSAAFNVREPLSEEMAFSSNVKTVRPWGPVSFATTSTVRDQVGFTPRRPRRLPAGFEIVQSQMVGTAGSPFVGLRISDGLVSGTVYQWLRERHERPPIGAAPMGMDRFGVAFFIEGEIPRSVQKRILETFVAAGR